MVGGRGDGERPTELGCGAARPVREGSQGLDRCATPAVLRETAGSRVTRRDPGAFRGTRERPYVTTKRGSDAASLQCSVKGVLASFPCAHACQVHRTWAHAGQLASAPLGKRILDKRVKAGILYDALTGIAGGSPSAAKGLWLSWESATIAL